jgi:hypothetical protein
MPAVGTYVLDTKRLRLRPLAQCNLDSLVGIIANPDVVKHPLPPSR